jgi:signal transduction histidine kinase
LEGTLHALDEDTDDARNRLRLAMDGLNQVIRDIRSYILDLRPRKMGEDGLVGGIKRLVAEFRANMAAEVKLSGVELDYSGLPDTHSTVLFHICQEALANVAKHSRAKKVQISLWASDERVLLEISDNGHGFDTEKMNMSIGHGLANMHTRAGSVGGEVDISSVLNEGSTVLAWVPRRAKT